MDRYLVRYFLAVIDQGNFSRAADACNVSQPTLSAGIAKLEREFGRPLFRRSNRRVELTAAGARLAGPARQIEASFAEAENAVRETAAPGLLRIGVLPSLPAAWIEQVMARLHADGNEQLEIVEARERDLVERLARGRIDVALTLLRPGAERHASEPIFTEGYALALPAAHPLAQRDLIAAEDLAGDDMIVRRHCELLSETSRHFTARGIRPFFAARTESDDRAIGYVRAGLGVTIMPECFRAEGMVRRPMAGFPHTRTIGLMFADHFDRAAAQFRLAALTGTISAAQAGQK